MLIGITGTIGSGKSRVAAYWAAFAALPLVDLDQICRELLCPGEVGWLAVRRAFGPAFFQENGRLDRARLREAISTDSDLRSRLDSLLHPLARKRMRHRVAGLTTDHVLVEIPLLFEAGWEEDVDRVVVVHASCGECRRRIIARDSVGSAQAERLIRTQMDQWQKVFRADHVIDNSGAWIDSCLQVRHLARILKADF